MTLVWCGNQRLDIDLIDELQAYHWERSNDFKNDKLTACSPFRYDKSPSFFVNLTDIGSLEIAGTWKDSGGGTSGNFVELLAHLQETDYDSALEYLVDKYAPVAYEEATKLHPWKDIKEFEPLLYPQTFFSAYLENRGISQETQSRLHVGSDLGDHTVSFPWCNPHALVMSVKHRKTTSKVFSYEEGGYRINQCLFGIDQVYTSKATTLWICEAEIDALTVWENGYASVALGGSSISDRQAEMILQSGVKRIVIASDNDKAGKDLAKKIKKKLYSLDIYEVKWNQEGDDINAYYLREDKLPLVGKTSLFPKMKRLSS